jgi:hypothetical protein
METDPVSETSCSFKHRTIDKVQKPRNFTDLYILDVEVESLRNPRIQYITTSAATYFKRYTVYGSTVNLQIKPQEAVVAQSDRLHRCFVEKYE